MHFKMRLFLYLLWACMVATTLQLQCDPMTQYPENDQCCKMCPPGNSMLQEPRNCEVPRCKECGENEYQDTYTHEEKCKHQEYCDPNKNFEVPVHHSKTVKSICKCKQGFHCSDKTCVTCLPHSVCEPGHEAVSLGNQSYDTVCQKCSEGTFSNISSWDSICKEWTQCGDGYYIQRGGTAESDNICAKPPRTHLIVISVLVSLVVIALVGLMYWRCRGNVKEKVKHYFCDDPFRGEEQHETTRDTCIDMLLQPKDLFPKATLPEQCTQEECSTPEGHGMTPEENLDEESQETANFTENGNFVTQERGKSEILSRQESQTHSSVQTNSE